MVFLVVGGLVVLETGTCVLVGTGVVLVEVLVGVVVSLSRSPMLISQSMVKPSLLGAPPAPNTEIVKMYVYSMFKNTFQVDIFFKVLKVSMFDAKV